MVNRPTNQSEVAGSSPALRFHFGYSPPEDTGGQDLAAVLTGTAKTKQVAPHVSAFLEAARDYYDTAKSAATMLCREFHYSHFLPPLTRAIGVWYDGAGVAAACCFGGAPARVWSQHPILELNRLVRREDVTTPLTGLISPTVKGLRWAFPDIVLLISYADAQEGHSGFIYQASSWNYAGRRESIVIGTEIDGKFYHQRTAVSKFGTSAIEALRKMHPGSTIVQIKDKGKHVYWKPLRRGGNQLAAQLKLGRQPYPKKAEAKDDAAPERAERKELDLADR